MRRGGFPRFLSRPHSCNYCGAVDGVAVDRPPKVKARLVWLPCACGRSHYACRPCAATVAAGGRFTRCARGFKVGTTREAR